MMRRPACESRLCVPAAEADVGERDGEWELCRFTHAPAGDSAAALVEAAAARERADDAAYRKTPQAATWELIRIRAVAETERRAREEVNEAMKRRAQ